MCLICLVTSPSCQCHNAQALKLWAPQFVRTEVPVQVPVEKMVVREVSVPHEVIVTKDRVVEVPVDRVVTKEIIKIMEVPMEKYIEVPVDKIVEKVVYQVIPTTRGMTIAMS